MTTDSWCPLSRRTGESSAADDPVEGVPPYLRMPLHNWVAKVFDAAAADVDPWGPKDDTLEREVTLRLGIPIPRYADGEQLLDVIDAALWFLSAKTPVSWGDRREYLASELQQILDAGRSAWRVNTGSSGLQRRLDEAVTATADETEAKVGDPRPSICASPGQKPTADTRIPTPHTGSPFSPSRLWRARWYFRMPTTRGRSARSSLTLAKHRTNGTRDHRQGCPARLRHDARRDAQAASGRPIPARR